MRNEPPKKCQICSMYYDSGNFCAKLERTELKRLNHNSQTATLKRGSHLNEDLLSHWPIVAVVSGVLSLQHILRDGRKTISAFFMQGDIIDFRNESENIRGSLIALTKVDICKLSPAVFNAILARNPDANSVVWSNLRAQAFRALDHVADLAKKQASEKLASFLFECRRRQPPNSRTGYVKIPVRRVDLAEYLGMQPETISRCFRDLENRKAIRLLNLSEVLITDFQILRAIANGDREISANSPNPESDFKILRIA